MQNWENVYTDKISKMVAKQARKRGHIVPLG